MSSKKQQPRNLLKPWRIYLLSALSGGFVSVRSEVVSGAGCGFRPARIFSDNMVLQRDVSVPVWGWSQVDQIISVHFDGQMVETEARAGERWQVRLAPMSAQDEPRQMIIRGTKSEAGVILSNVVVGDVWLCMGQSNMEMIMGFESEENYRGILHVGEELKDTRYPNLRLLNVPKSGANYPVPDIPVQWHPSTPETAEYFSAVAYTFGRELFRRTGVPVGLIHVSMGGADIQRFTPRELQVRLPEYYHGPLADFARQWARIETAAAGAGTSAREVIREWERSIIDVCTDAEAQPPSLEWVRRNYTLPEPAVPLGQGPGSIYYGMIAPLLPYGIAGVVWFQGESNLADGEGYGVKLTAWVGFLRDMWRRDNLPFLAVEIPPYDFHKTDWPMKNAPMDQRDKLNRGIRAVLQLPNTATVNTEDLANEPDNLHPRNKAPIGKRLAALAEATSAATEHIHQPTPRK